MAKNRSTKSKMQNKRFDIGFVLVYFIQMCVNNNDNMLYTRIAKELISY